MPTPTPESQVTGKYQIGAVCAITGLSQHVLRVWEKRYAVVSPTRQLNRRREYSEADVQKLAILKALVDRGHSIGSIAALPMDVLEARLAKSEPTPRPDSIARTPCVLIIGPGLALGNPVESPSGRFEVLARFDDLHQALASESLPRADIAVVEWPSLFADAVLNINQTLRRLNTNRLILIYDFAARDALAALNKDRISAVRGPLGPETLDALIQTLANLAPPTPTSDLPPAARLFDDRTLSRITRVSSDIKCECPRHLARIVASLANFEAYSADCESLNEYDAELHGLLYRITGRVRSEMERALGKVIEAEELGEILDLPVENADEQ